MEVKFILFGVWVSSTLALFWCQAVNPIPIKRPWNWKNPHEKFMVTSFASWVLMMISSVYEWRLPV